MTLNRRIDNDLRLTEPFRLFFPAGMLFGLMGILLWPAFYAGWLPYYPGFAHTRLMIDGFAGFFVFGFLMTAGPPLLGTAAFSRNTVLGVFGLSVATCVAQLFNQTALGDALFALATGYLIFNAGKAYRCRSDCPPPGFPLAALGLACACIGSLLLSLSTTAWPNATTFALGKILLFQGFTLLPIVGVGAFFFPKIFGGRNIHAFPEMRLPSDEWKRRFRHSLYVAIGFFASVALEIVGRLPFAYSLRLIVLGAYLLSEIPFGEFRKRQNMYGAQLLFTLATVGIGLAGAALFPAYKIAWLHSYFLVGLTGIIFLVSIRVVFGHSGRPDLIQKSVPIFAWVTGALAFAAATRIYADFNSNLQISHYLYATAIWFICGLIWLLFVAPKTRLAQSKRPGPN